jgi:glycosyltransferase involved in cell wall biosynthesis
LARYRAAAKIIAISQAVRLQLLAAGLGAGRIEVVADGVEIPSCLTSEVREEVRRRWGFRSDEVVLVNVGALTAEKGHQLLIDAFGKLWQQFAKCRLLIAGEGPLRTELEQRARNAGLESLIVFAGFVADIDSVYAAADLFVFPSLQEGAGTSLLRAMAFGLPVLALARGGVTEIIEDGKNGIVIQEASPQALAWAAAGMLGEPELRQQLGEAARQAVAARSSADRMVEETMGVFERLIAKAASTRV